MHAASLGKAFWASGPVRACSGHRPGLHLKPMEAIVPIDETAEEAAKEAAEEAAKEAYEEAYRKLTRRPTRKLTKALSSRTLKQVRIWAVS